MKHPSLPVWTLFALATTSWAAEEPRFSDKPTPEQVELFEQKIRPVLVKHCHSCHSAEAKKVRGDFRLDTRADLRRGGSSGAVVVPGKPEESLLIKAMRHDDDVAPMPPKEKLPREVVADFEAWVKMGLPDPRDGQPATQDIKFEKGKRLWSLQPVQRPAVPKIESTTASTHNEIDAFILAKLNEKGLKPNPLTDRRTLLRRATFDLTGLPPTPEEIEAFLNDKSPDAFATVVERLLASPAYGERWGRHWMDVVRYADTAGDNSDYPIPQIYLYRNWIIDAINRDLPYDEFVRQQLAGDLLPSTSEADRHAKLIATGYLANTRRFGSYEEARYPWYLTYEDQIDNVGRAFLGLTINCCRCHDHKFDPLTQHDYYALYGFFSSTRYPRPGIEMDQVQRDFVPLAPPETVAEANRRRDEQLKALHRRIRERSDDKRKAEKQLAGEEKHKDAKKRTSEIAKLRKRLESLNKQIDSLRKELDRLERTPASYPTAYAVAEGPVEGKRKIGNACVQIKGDPERLGPVVPRRFPTVLGGYALPPDEKGSGRLHLANWIVDPKNPLTARVMVNRLWQYHFGRGLVRTANNFGTLGHPPTHPELLDWLATEFVAKNWSLKAVHRRIMLSRTYQQSSVENPDNAKIDVANDLLWRYPRRRLDAESIRDALLAVGGNLDRTPGEKHPFPDPKTWRFTQHNPFKAVYDTNKRSVYLMTQRFQRHPFLALFDGPDTNASTATRITSTTPLQALYLMNDPFVHRQAHLFASRLRSEVEEDAARVDRAFELLCGRLPTDAERSTIAESLAKAAEQLKRQKLPADRIAEQSWASLARAMILTNEFAYVD